MPPTRSPVEPEHKLHESEKAHRPEFHPTCGLFVSFSVLSASVFCPRAPVRRGWMLCRVWEPQPASAHGCASSALVRVPARSRGAGRSWTPLRVPAVRVSASLLARAQAAFPVWSLAPPLARAQAVHPVQSLVFPPARAQAAFPVRSLASPLARAQAVPPVQSLAPPLARM